MMPATICKEIKIHAPAAHVWQFVGTEAGLRQWWLVDVTFEARMGGRYVERGVRNGQPYQLDGVVTLYDPPRQLRLLLHDGPSVPSSPTSMSIAITLEEVAGETVVRVVHQMYAMLPTVQPRRQPAPPIPRPIGEQPVILNQLPAGHTPVPDNAGERNSLPIINPGSIVVDMDWSNTYEVRWAGRLSALMKLMRSKEVNYDQDC
jgi:uncharacterized protein YndB with AHSA1/START domain